MAYEAVDHIITRWAGQHDLTLLTEFGGHERRFCYVTGGAQESFQISVEPPEEAEILVNVWSIETIDDTEFHRSWSVAFDGLSDALDAAFDQIRTWTDRPKRLSAWRLPSS